MHNKKKWNFCLSANFPTLVSVIHLCDYTDMHRYTRVKGLLVESFEWHSWELKVTTCTSEPHAACASTGWRNYDATFLRVEWPITLEAFPAILSASRQRSLFSARWLLNVKHEDIKKHFLLLLCIWEDSLYIEIKFSMKAIINVGIVCRCWAWVGINGTLSSNN